MKTTDDNVFCLGGILKTPVELLEAIRSILSSDSQSDSVEFNEKLHTLVIVSKLPVQTVTWNIPMDRLETTPDVKCEFLLELLANLLARAEHLEDLLGIGAAKDTLSPVFAAGNVPQCFTISENRKTINSERWSNICKVGDTTTAWRGFLSEQPISAFSNKFVVSLVALGTTNLMVGVAKRGAVTNGILSKTESWMLHLHSNNSLRFCGPHVATCIGISTTFRFGSRIAVSVTENGLLCFESDGTLVHSSQLTCSDASELFAAVNLLDPGQSVTFV